MQVISSDSPEEAGGISTETCWLLWRNKDLDLTFVSVMNFCRGRLSTLTPKPEVTKVTVGRQQELLGNIRAQSPRVNPSHCGNWQETGILKAHSSRYLAQLAYSLSLPIPGICQHCSVSNQHKSQVLPGKSLIFHQQTSEGLIFPANHHPPPPPVPPRGTSGALEPICRIHSQGLFLAG